MIDPEMIDRTLITRNDLLGDHRLQGVFMEPMNRLGSDTLDLIGLLASQLHRASDTIRGYGRRTFAHQEAVGTMAALRPTLIMLCAKDGPGALEWVNAMYRSIQQETPDILHLDRVLRTGFGLLDPELDLVTPDEGDA